MALRYQNLLDLNQLKDAIRCSASGLNKMPPYLGHVSRIATLDNVELEQYVPGQTTLIRTFLSTTKGEVDDNTALASFCGTTKFEIESTGGRDIEWLSSAPLEREVLFNPGSEFRVVSVKVEPTPWSTTELLHGTCARNYPKRTVITMQQVPSGTYATEHPGEREGLPIGALNSAADVERYLGNKELADAHGYELVALYLKKSGQQAKNGAELEQILLNFQNLCKRWVTRSEAFNQLAHKVSCQAKNIEIKGSFVFRGLPLAANTAITFHPNGLIEQVQIDKDTVIQGYALSGDLTFTDDGKLSSFRYTGSKPINVGGQPIMPKPESEVKISPQGQIINISIDKTSAPYVYKGLKANGYLKLYDDGSMRSLSTDDAGTLGGISFGGRGSTITFFPDHSINSVAANSIHLADNSLITHDSGLNTVTFFAGGKINSIQASMASGSFTYKGVTYKTIFYREDGSPAAMLPLSVPPNLRFPCNVSKITGYIFYNAKGEQVGCESYATDFTYNGVKYSKLNPFGLGDDGKPADVSTQAKWNDFKARFIVR